MKICELREVLGYIFDGKKIESKYLGKSYEIDNNTIEKIKNDEYLKNILLANNINIDLEDDLDIEIEGIYKELCDYLDYKGLNEQEKKLLFINKFIDNIDLEFGEKNIFSMFNKLCDSLTTLNFLHKYIEQTYNLKEYIE